MPSLKQRSGILFYSHNQVDYVVSGLNSIMLQEVSGTVELVIIDDGSTDGTATVIENWMLINSNVLKEKFTTVKFEHRNGQIPRGQTATLLEGLSQLDTDYIYILEGDDEWILPSHIRSMELIFEKYPWIAACGSSWISLSDSNLIYGAFEKPFNLSFVQSLWDSRRLLGPNFSTLSAMGYRGDIIKEVLPKLLLCHEVADLGLNIFVSQRGPIYWCNEVSLKWRHVPNSAWRKLPLKEQAQRSIRMLRDYAQHLNSETSSMLIVEAGHRESALSFRSKFAFGIRHPLKAVRILVRKLTRS